MRHQRGRGAYESAHVPPLSVDGVIMNFGLPYGAAVPRGAGWRIEQRMRAARPALTIDGRHGGSREPSVKRGPLYGYHSDANSSIRFVAEP
jgi:hypothetical protein